MKLNLQQFAAPGSTNALRNETFDNLQLNAGIFLKNFDYSEISDSDELKSAIVTAITTDTNVLGATRGGGTFTVTREMRTPEVDGMRYNFKGGNFVDSVDAYLSTTLVEVTASNVRDLLAGVTTTDGLKTTINMRTAISDADYLENVCWVGDLSDGRLVLICLKNAINTADFTLTFADKNEGTLAVEFHACQAQVNDYDEAPFEVVFFDTDGEAGALTVESAAGTNVGETTLTVDNTLAASEHYVYKVGTSSAAPTASYHTQADYTWTEWSGSGAINVGASANGKKATLAVIDSNNRFIKSGTVTLVVKTA